MRMQKEGTSGENATSEEPFRDICVGIEVETAHGVRQEANGNGPQYFVGFVAKF